MFARFSAGCLSLLACGFSRFFAPGVALRLGSELPLKAVEGVALRSISVLPPAWALDRRLDSAACCGLLFETVASSRR